MTEKMEVAVAVLKCRLELEASTSPSGLEGQIWQDVGGAEGERAGHRGPGLNHSPPRKCLTFRAPCAPLRLKSATPMQGLVQAQKAEITQLKGAVPLPQGRFK